MTSLLPAPCRRATSGAVRGNAGSSRPTSTPRTARTYTIDVVGAVPAVSNSRCLPRCGHARGHGIRTSAQRWYLMLYVWQRLAGPRHGRQWAGGHWPVLCIPLRCLTCRFRRRRNLVAGGESVRSSSSVLWSMRLPTSIPVTVCEKASALVTVYELFPNRIGFSPRRHPA
jgi:hypothetical protein